MITRAEVEEAYQNFAGMIHAYGRENPLPNDYSWCCPGGKIMIADHEHEDLDTGNPRYLNPPAEGVAFEKPAAEYTLPAVGTTARAMIDYMVNKSLDNLSKTLFHMKPFRVKTPDNETHSS